MNLSINIKNWDTIELKLVQNKKVIDYLTFQFKANLDTLLIGAVDKIFKRNKIESSSLKTIEVKAKSGLDGSSAYNIATVVGKAIKSSN